MVHQNPEITDLKVLITGGGGFLGSHLCQWLLGLGCEVHATSRIERERDGRGPIWWRADMADLSMARSVVAAVKPDIVYHLAGSVGASPDLELVVPTYQSLLTSTLNVLLAGTEACSGRIILSGSFTEPQPSLVHPTPHSPYAAAKWAASGYGRMFNILFQAPVVILQPFMVYGPRQAPAKLIPTVIKSLLGDTAPKVTSGKRRADWVYVDDVIDGFVLAATTKGIEGATIDLGSGRLVSIREIVERIVAIVGSAPSPIFGAVPDRPAENEVIADTEFARARLGWTAKTSLDEGLRRTVHWYRDGAIAAVIAQALSQLLLLNNWDELSALL
ncbi:MULTISPECIES: NAD-dependent epimerase/dehydratase family protein [unclassified Mesorhizobium]|uniref:NAD-dependent epimerase/dehydratase family protein n=1 Tax=unclassified Mesorhizobium TaxID=325217 RepID=UPI00142EB98F|nr:MULTISPECIES: NAD-dependent epimerase/dehydratase family protein [unclassified Mesorhizobium]